MKEKYVMTKSKNPLPPEEVIPEQELQYQQHIGRVEQGFVRVSTGVIGLDEILDGGLIQSAPTSCAAVPDVGKRRSACTFSPKERSEESAAFL
jgi:hypothetical protein